MQGDLTELKVRDWSCRRVCEERSVMVEALVTVKLTSVSYTFRVDWSGFFSEPYISWQWLLLDEPFTRSFDYSPLWPHPLTDCL